MYSLSGAMPCSHCFLMEPNASGEARVAIPRDERFMTLCKSGMMLSQYLWARLF